MAAPGSATFTFNDDPVGAASPSFESLVGEWRVAEVDGARVLRVAAKGALVAAREVPTGDVRVSVRFTGKLDHAAGIAFGIAADGSCHGVSASSAESSIAYFRFANGKRTVFETVRDVPAKAKVWHTMILDVRGNIVNVYFDNQRRFERPLDAAAAGRLGVWAQGEVVFDDFAMTPL